MINFLTNKSEAELKKKELKEIRKISQFKDLNEEELNCIYKIHQSFRSKFNDMDKNTISSLAIISKIMADTESDNTDIIIAQNFLIIDMLGKLINKKD